MVLPYGFERLYELHILHRLTRNAIARLYNLSLEPGESEASYQDVDQTLHALGIPIRRRGLRSAQPKPGWARCKMRACGHVVLPISEMIQDPQRPTFFTCKKCMATRSRSYYERNRDTLRAKSRDRQRSRRGQERINDNANLDTN